jgi:acetyltransferase-like isoleucine patch superfamily enzyme
MLQLLQRMRVWLFRRSWTCSRVEIGKDVKFLTPVRITGAGRVVIGEGVTFGHVKSPLFFSHYILLDARSANACIQIGSNVIIGNGSSIMAFDSRIQIGTECLLGPQTTIVDSDFHPLAASQRRDKPESRPVKLGKNVTTGFSSFILKGADVGDDCFIGAAAVVTRSAPPAQILAGSPARYYPLPSLEVDL